MKKTEECRIQRKQSCKLRRRQQEVPPGPRPCGNEIETTEEGEEEEEEEVEDAVTSESRCKWSSSWQLLLDPCT